MSKLEITIWPEISQDMMEKLKDVLRQKLPSPVDDTVLTDIILTQNKLIEEYLRTLET